MKKWIITTALTGILAMPVLAATSTWELDPAHSNAEFRVRHMGISNVQGDFTKITGTAQIDDSDITKSSVSVTIDASSVDTRVSRRDDDLKSPNFFDVAKYPTITFQSTSVMKSGDGLKVTGNLTIHGVTKPVTLDVTGPSAPISTKNGPRRGISATTQISRKDFGITADAGMIGDEINIQIDSEMSMPAAAK